MFDFLSSVCWILIGIIALILILADEMNRPRGGSAA